MLRSQHCFVFVIYIFCASIIIIQHLDTRTIVYHVPQHRALHINVRYRKQIISNKFSLINDLKINLKIHFIQVCVPIPYFMSISSNFFCFGTSNSDILLKLLPASYFFLAGLENSTRFSIKIKVGEKMKNSFGSKQFFRKKKSGTRRFENKTNNTSNDLLLESEKNKNHCQTRWQDRTKN